MTYANFLLMQYYSFEGWIFNIWLFMIIKVNGSIWIFLKNDRFLLRLGYVKARETAIMDYVHAYDKQSKSIDLWRFCRQFSL